MRIQYTMFLLTVRVEHTDINRVMTIDAYGSNFDQLTTQNRFDGSVQTIDVFTTMPNRIMLVLSCCNQQNAGAVKLLSMSLAGSQIVNSLLSGLVEYKPAPGIKYQDSIEQYLENPSTHSLQWDHPGCALFNLFNPDPFAYHMFIGNKIKF